MSKSAGTLSPIVNATRSPTNNSLTSIVIASLDPLNTAIVYSLDFKSNSASFCSDFQLLKEVTVIIMTRAMAIETPSISPSGKPSLIKPITMETTEAPRRTRLIVSSKFSITSSNNVLITGGGNLFSPYF